MWQAMWQAFKTTRVARAHKGIRKRVHNLDSYVAPEAEQTEYMHACMFHVTSACAG